MRIKYKKSFTDRFIKQLDYIAFDSKDAAKSFQKGFLIEIKRIRNNPQICRKSIYFNDANIRDLIFKGYVIIYRINEHEIEVFGFVKYQDNPTD